MNSTNQEQDGSEPRSPRRNRPTVVIKEVRVVPLDERHEREALAALAEILATAETGADPAQKEPGLTLTSGGD